MEMLAGTSIVLGADDGTKMKDMVKDFCGILDNRTWRLVDGLLKGDGIDLARDFLDKTLKQEPDIIAKDILRVEEALKENVDISNW